MPIIAAHILLLLLFLSGCATVPRQELQTARMAVAEAEYVEAGRWAPEEFARASETLKEGEELLRQGDYELASVLLPRARELARQAQIRAEQEKIIYDRLREKSQETTPPATTAPKATPTRPPAKTKPADETLSPPLPVHVTVEGSQTLWVISSRKDVYDDPLLWPLLYQANRDQIRDPRQIHPGQILKIPRDVPRQEREEAREKARRSEIFAEYRFLRQQPPRKSP